jgi:hypothetical protein
MSTIATDDSDTLWSFFFMKFMKINGKRNDFQSYDYIYDYQVNKRKAKLTLDVDKSVLKKNDT